MKIKFILAILTTGLFLAGFSASAQYVKPINKAIEDQKSAQPEKIDWRKKVDPKLYDMPQDYKVPYIIK
jgi:hypothetical protein